MKTIYFSIIIGFITGILLGIIKNTCDKTIACFLSYLLGIILVTSILVYSMHKNEL